MTSRLLACALPVAAIGCWPAPALDADVETSSASDGAAMDCLGAVEDAHACEAPPCTPCLAGAACTDHDDCATGYCAASRCEYLASCRAVQEQGWRESGLYWVDFDGVGEREPERVLCDQDTDGGGWTLAFKVNPASQDHVAERRESLSEGFNPHLLRDTAMDVDRGLASLGAAAVSQTIGLDSWARLTLVAAVDERQTATWFKRIASPYSLSRWFVDDAEASEVCLQPELDPTCRVGTMAPRGDATVLGGVTLADHGFTAVDDLALGLDGDRPDPAWWGSGVRSGTLNNDGNAWHDTLEPGGDWGNGLLIWIR